MKNFLLVGHRGVGKSHLLSEIKKLYPELQCFELDEQIVDRVGKSIEDIFKQEGEAYFRNLEKQVLSDLIAESQGIIVIDVGAGFEGPMPAKVCNLWVTRSSHNQGSTILDRPPLDGQLKISSQRFTERNQRYTQWADIKLQLNEGPFSLGENEKKLFDCLFFNSPGNQLDDYYCSVNKETTDFEIATLRKLGIRGLEWRDDLCEVVDFKSGDIFSVRKSAEVSEPDSILWDYPLEFGLKDEASIQSLHEKGSSVEGTVSRFSKVKGREKLAIPIADFDELSSYHKWWRGNPQKRCFLPMSDTGRWHWYRLRFAKLLNPNFLKLADQGTAKDQPTLLQVLTSESGLELFGAVLGAPVQHSYSPSFHGDFFRQKKANFYAIDVKPEEFEAALTFLQSIGLRWAAVTSPLKEKAAQWINSSSPINTLFFDGDQWTGISTDGQGLARSIKNVSWEKVAVWGGGGVLQSLEKSFPEADYYSSRTGELKKGRGESPYDTLVWGVGRENFSKQGVFPPRSWPLKRVIDLNYAQDSPGVECSVKFNCQYISGVGMFQEQARLQQEFWNECRFK